MRRFIGLCIILAIAVLVGLGVAKLPGYVLLQVADSAVAVPLWLALLGVIVLATLLVILWRIVRFFVLIPSHWREMTAKNRLQRQQKCLQQALKGWIIGDWPVTEKALKKLSKTAFSKSLSQMLRAFVAGKSGNRALENDQLNQARQNKQADKVIVNIMRMDALIRHQQYSEAKVILASDLVKHQRNLQVIKRAFFIEFGLRNWVLARQHLHTLEKEKLLSEAELQTYQQQVYRGILQQAAEQSIDVLQAAWRDLPAALQSESVILQTYAELLKQKAAIGAAEKCLRKALNHHYDERLLLCYSQLGTFEDINPLEYAEKWFNADAPTALSLWAMGNLCAAESLYGRAQHYFESSLAIDNNPQVHAALGRLYAQQGQFEAAVKEFQL